MMTQPPRRFSAHELLSIDVGAELRKLALAQLQGPWQLPAEFVRRSVRLGASQVDVGFGHDQVTVVDDGAGLSPEVLQWTAAVLDPRRPNPERHAALTALEARGEVALLAIAGLAPPLFRVRSCGQGVAQTLELRDGSVHTDVHALGVQTTSCELLLRLRGFDRRAARAWLANAARFAPARLRIDGHDIARGFPEALASFSLQAPLRGRVAVPREGETCRIWLLDHGIVADHITRPEVPAFEAAIELGRTDARSPVTPLRESFAPLLPELIAQGVRGLIHLAPSLARQPELVRARVAHLLLQARADARLAGDIDRAAVFRTIDLAGPRLVDLHTLRQAGSSLGGRTVLRALYPGQNPQDYDLTGPPVLVAGEVERGRLVEALGLPMAPPQRRDTQLSRAAAMLQALAAVPRAVGRAAAFVRSPFRPAPIPDKQLESSELALLQQLRVHMGADSNSGITALSLCEGAGPIRRGRDHARLLLPRRNPTVRACIDALAADANWVYPAFLALLEGYASPPESLRKVWVSGQGALR